MALEALHLEHVPADHIAYVTLFRDVTNADFLQQQLLARNADFQYAFIDASSVLSRVQVLAATYKALAVFLEGTLKTNNVHSEIVAALSPSKNIAEAYRRWGITAATKDVIIVKVLYPTAERPEPLSADAVWAHLLEHVKGTPVPLADDEIAKSTDLAKIRKYYKLNGAGALELNKKDEAANRKEMEVLVLGAMALRNL